MDVCIAVPGTWHAIHLARQLQRRNALDIVYTTYPQFKLDTTGLDDRITSIRYPEAVLQTGTKFPVIDTALARVTPWARPTARIKDGLFDRAVARRVRRRDPDIFVGFAGASLRSLRAANAGGATTILERCSSHIRTQARLLRKESQRHGTGGDPISTAHVEREQREYEVADYVSVPSEFVYDSFLEHEYPEERLILEPYATDVEEFSPAEHDDEGPVRFLFAGGVGFRKGIPDLLRGWDIADLNGAELLVAGRVEPEVADLTAEYEADPSVQFLGWCDDIATVYQQSDVFAFPSIEEGSAHATYEAMASALPLVTTPNSGWVGEDGVHGFEVPIRDPQAFADALRRMHDNPERRREMGTVAREKILSDCTWDDYGQRVVQRYRSIL